MIVGLASEVDTDRVDPHPGEHWRDHPGKSTAAITPAPGWVVTVAPSLIRPGDQQDGALAARRALNCGIVSVTVSRDLSLRVAVEHYASIGDDRHILSLQVGCSSLNC
jgi:hypothetical protein